MTIVWREVALKEIAKPVLRAIPVLPGSEYRTIGVKWWGEGAYERETIDGSRTAAKTLSLVRNDDLIINKIWVRHGSTAIAGQDVDGCAASGEFPTFELDLQQVLPRWLHWHTKTRGFWTKCDALSRGSSGKNRIKPELFLTIRVPLPSVAEQRRIVERIEAIAGKVEEAKRLRGEAEEEAEVLWARAAAGICDRAVENSPLRTLADIVAVRGGGTPAKSNPFFWDGRIPWVSPKDMKSREIHDSIDHISESATSESAAKVVEPGAVLVVVRGMILTHTVPIAVLRKPAAINQDIKALIPCSDLLPEYLSGLFWAYNHRLLDLVEKSTHDTRKLQTAKLLATKIPVPPIDQQWRVVGDLMSLQMKIGELVKHQSSSAVAIDAVMPAVLDQAFRGGL